ncbi:MAG TPA: PatB family C-S lyase [Bacteroidales bacterium]|nr:PatB family C-S lyase [Bacteroidales bacterium]HPS16061.1 PatB family C-S lyase [Bacteroidales bacterium]
MKYNFDEIIQRENTACVKYDLRKELFGREDVIPMWVADMDFKSPDFVVKVLHERLSHEIYGYSIRPEGFYNSIINWLQKRHAWKIQREWISVSPGVVPAMAICVQAFTKPGDKIIIQPPVYHPFFHVVEKNQRQLVCNPLKNINNYYHFDFDDLEQKIDKQTRMLILSNPHNPVGRVWTKDELIRLSEICIRNNIIILSDEIHSDLIYRKYKHIPLASISEEISQHVITAIAPSKTFNLAGLSTSALIIPNKKLFSIYESTLNNIEIGMGNLFGNIALEAAYTHGEDWLEQLLDYLQKNIDFIKVFLQKNLPDIKLIEPEGTYLLWLDFRNLKLNQNELNDILIKKAKVGFNDGAIFGKEGEGFQRMNIACPLSVIEKALTQIKEAIIN